VLGVSADILLGGHRREELEAEFQKSVQCGIEVELFVCEKALREYPDDEQFQYRRAVCEFFIGEGGKTYLLNRARIHFKQLVEKHPEDDCYRGFLARVYHAQGCQDDAIREAKICKDRDVLLGMILEGEELLHHKQKIMMKKARDFMQALESYNTKESLEIADKLRLLYFGDSGEYCCCRWNSYYCLANLYLKENNIEKLMINGEKIIDDDNQEVIVDTANDPTKLLCGLHMLQLENFIAAINGDETLIADCYEGKKAIKIIEQIYT
jgi:tetratricopeptide (TPR) repeat protein